MNLDFRAFLAELASASLRTKALTVVALVAVVALASVAGVVAADPHFVTLYSGLDDAERVAVEKALAGGGVKFRTSNYPGPYVVYVDEGEFDHAQIQVAMAEALRRAPTGINTGEDGASTIFMSSGERAQTMLKREWQETESLLVQFDFVERAKVTTSRPETSMLGRKEPITVSVALTLRGGRELSPEQAENVAKLVRFRFGVPPENVVISDQAGHTVYDPGMQGSEADTRRMLQHGTAFDQRLTEKVNDALARAFGPDMAYVTVTSSWDTDQTTTVSETLDGESRELTIEKTKSQLEGADPGAGGLAGSSSNLATEFGTESAATGERRASGGSTTTDERTTYEVPRTRTQTVRLMPHLERLNVSLVIDAGLEEKREEIRSMVAAAVGFDESRKDTLGVTVAEMRVEQPEAGEGAEDGAQTAPEPQGTAAPSPTLELLIQRGVEIIAALAFILILFASLRGSKKAAAGAADGPAAAGGEASTDEARAAEADPELLARAQIEELVKSDPRRVGEILSRWASEESGVGA